MSEVRLLIFMLAGHGVVMHNLLTVCYAALEASFR